MNPSAPFRAVTPARLATFALTLLTAATVGCNESHDQPFQSDFTTLRSIHGDTGADSIGSLDATTPPANLNDYRHPSRFRVSTSYHPQPH